MEEPPNVGLPDRSRVQEFINLNLPEFTGLDPKEDPHKFNDELQRTFKAKNVIELEAVGLASYRMRDVAVF